MKSLVVIATVLCVVVAYLGGGVSARDVEVQLRFSRLLQMLKKSNVGANDGFDVATCDGFQCADSGRCITRRWVCDGDADCADRSDEINCSCAGEFKCANSGKCIPRSFQCDGDVDCSDRSDEANCVATTATTTTEASQTRCTLDQFKCANYEICRPRSDVCDGYGDCPDRSDEANCAATVGTATTVASQTSCTSDQFQCANLARCIPRRWLCDGDGDCSDRSDEANCPTTTTIPTQPTCTSDQFQCANLARCIPRRWLCDGDGDCSDRSDEANCGPISDVPDCEDDILVTDAGTDVQTTPSTDSSFGDWLGSVLELLDEGEGSETSTDFPDDDTEYEDEDVEEYSSGSGDDQDDTESGYGPTTRLPGKTTRKLTRTVRPRVTRPSITSSSKTVKPEVNENDVLDFLEALSRLDGNRVRVKRAADSAVGQERRRRCKVSKRQYKKLP